MTPTPSIDNHDLTGIVAPFHSFWTDPKLKGLYSLLKPLTSIKGLQIQDGILSGNDLKTLFAAVAKLENVPRESQDWRKDRPHVLELVDPSLHLFTHGLSVVLPIFDETCPAFERMDVQADEYSSRFQWLPADVSVDPESKRVSIESYINGLNPATNGELYSSIEAILGGAVPQFEKVLTDLVSEAPTFTSGRSEPVSLAARKLQMIIGLKNVHLSPELPDYPGSDWHTEGLLNERIVASAIYYYDMENITESGLGFRVQVDKREYLDLGYVEAQPNRMIAFPNVYQNIVRPFKLLDSSKPGHRKIVTVFFIDPSKRIVSSASVPPQQHDWYYQNGAQVESKAEKDEGMSSLETEMEKLRLSVKGQMRYGRPIKLEEAQKLREASNLERAGRKCCSGGKRD